MTYQWNTASFNHQGEFWQVSEYTPKRISMRKIEALWFENDESSGNFELRLQKS